MLRKSLRWGFEKVNANLRARARLWHLFLLDWSAEEKVEEGFTPLDGGRSTLPLV